MSQTPRPKNHLDILQSMINAILIETGRALRSAQKEDGRPSLAVTTRLRGIIPSTTENFHTALDELECEILRAKAVILRDYEELRAKRIALENPEPIIEESETQTMEDIESEMNGTLSIPADSQQDATASIKEESGQTGSPEKQTVQASQDTLKEGTSQTPNYTKGQNPTPPSSETQTGADSKPIGLGIVTDGEVPAPGPATAELQNSSIDSLFDAAEDNEQNAGDSSLEFMDFFQDTSTNTQGNDQSQTQNNDFDFGSTSQDFHMPDLHTAVETTNTNANNANNANKPDDDSFAMADTTAEDNMDIDLEDLGMAGADDSIFDDMYFPGDNDNSLGGGEMEHGEFDNAFFGLDS